MYAGHESNVSTTRDCSHGQLWWKYLHCESKSSLGNCRHKTVSSLSVLADDISIHCCIETLWTFTANMRLHSFMTKYVVGRCSVILIVDTPRHPHCQFQSLPQLNCLHIHTTANISAPVNNHMQTVIAVHRYNTWNSDSHVAMYCRLQDHWWTVLEAKTKYKDYNND